MRRRGKGEGGLTHRGDGSWQASYVGSDDRRHYLYAPTRKEAAVALAAALRDKELGVFVAGPSQTVDQYLTTWLRHAGGRLGALPGGHSPHRRRGAHPRPEDLRLLEHRRGRDPLPAVDALRRDVACGPRLSDRVPRLRPGARMKDVMVSGTTVETETEIPTGFRRAVVRLCAYEGCDWHGTVDETPYIRPIGASFDPDNLAAAQHLAHMFYVHGYPYQRWQFKAIRRAYMTIAPGPAITEVLA